CDRVQTHMPNSRLTDPEILEGEFPVLLREFSIRHGSGGAGRETGGAGTVRRLEFRAPLSGALLANHRRIAPFGLARGRRGSPGAARLRRPDGTLETLAATARLDGNPGGAAPRLAPAGVRVRGA